MKGVGAEAPAAEKRIGEDDAAAVLNIQVAGTEMRLEGAAVFAHLGDEGASEVDVQAQGLSVLRCCQREAPLIAHRGWI